MEFLQDVGAAALGSIIGCLIGFWIGDRIYNFKPSDPEEEHCDTCHDVHEPAE